MMMDSHDKKKVNLDNVDPGAIESTKPFDAYEIRPVVRFGTMSPKSFCEPYARLEEAMREVEQASLSPARVFWSLYGHIHGEGLESIFDSKDKAGCVRLYRRIANSSYSQDSIDSCDGAAEFDLPVRFRDDELLQDDEKVAAEIPDKAYEVSITAAYIGSIRVHATSETHARELVKHYTQSGHPVDYQYSSVTSIATPELLDDDI